MESDLQAARDELARVLGWTVGTKTIGDTTIPYYTKPDHFGTSNNPIPNTIDGLAKLWPEGDDWYHWIVERCGNTYTGTAARDDSGESEFVTAEGDTEYSCRLRLLLAVLKAKGSHD